MNSGEKIKKYWDSIPECKYMPGLSESCIAKYENKYLFKFPIDFRNYLKVVNGMCFDSIDCDMIRFWTIKEIFNKKIIKKNINKLKERWIIFADYCLESHFYAIVISSEKTFGNVGIYDGQEFIKFNIKFDEFSDIYVKKNILFYGSKYIKNRNLES